MTTEQIVLAVIGSNGGMGMLAGLLFWGWRKFTKRIDENRDLTLAKVAELSKDLKAMAQMAQDHQDADSALFQNLGGRLSTVEGAVGVHTAILTARKES